MSNREKPQTNPKDIIKRGVSKFLPGSKREDKISPNSTSPTTSPPNTKIPIPTFALSDEYSKDKLTSFRLYAANQADLFPSDRDPFAKPDQNLLDLSKHWSDYIAKIDFTEKGKFLQQVALSFNNRYNVWNEEFELDCLKRPEYVKKTFFIPFLEKSNKTKVQREFEDYLNNVVEAIRENLPFHEQYGIENIYLMNMLSRTADNIHKIGVKNIINPIVHLIKIVLVRYKTPFSINIKNIEAKDPEQTYVQILLANCIQILLNCVSFQGSWRKTKPLRIKEIEEVIRESKKEAVKQGTILVLKGYLDHLNSIANTYGPLSGSQEDFQLLLVNTIGAFLFRSTIIKNSIAQTGILEVLFGWIGWPEKLMKDADLITAANNPKLRDEFRLQLLCLNIIQEAMGPNHQTVERITSIGGWDIIMDTILWITEIFSINPYLACAKMISTGDVKKESVSNWNSASVPNSNTPPVIKKRNPIENTNNFSAFRLDKAAQVQEIVQPNTKELKQLFEILFSMCEKVDTEESEEFSFRLVLNVNRYIIKMISDIFNNDVRPTANNSRVRAKLKKEYPELQIVILHFVRDLLSIHPESISFCARFGIWDVLFTEYFFYCGLHSDLSQINDEFNSTRHQCFNSIKFRVLKFIQFAASMDDHDNIEECKKLFDLLCTYHSRADLVSNVVDSLINIVKNNLRATQSSIIRLNSISTFCMIISEYLFIFRQMHMRPQEVPADFQIVNNILSKMMRLVTSLLMRNEDMLYFLIKDSKFVNILFSLLYDPILREYAFPVVINLMAVRIESKRSEEDLTELLKFYHLYFTTINRIQSSSLVTNFELLLLLLEGIRSTIKKSQSTRKIFKEANVFSQIINCLNNETRVDRKPDLCLESLKCFTALLTDSEKNKTFIRNNVGYSNIKQIILTILNQDVEGKLRDEILPILFDLLVDGDFDINAKYEIQNSDIIPLIFDLFPALSLAQREEVITVFTNIVGKCPLNQSLCSRKYLIFFLLEMLPVINRHGDLMGKVVSLIETLGSFSITVKELKRKFLLLTSEQGNFRPWIQNRLLKALQFMALAPTTGPVSFFDFDGKTSSLIIPPLEKWPHNHGYTFLIWFRAESFISETKDEKGSNYPRLISFIDENDIGLEVYLVPGELDAKLEISIKIAAGKNTIHTFSDYSFNTRRWYLVTVTHISHRNLPFRIHNNENEIKLYVNGEFVERQVAKYPQFPGVLNNIRIGAHSKGATKLRKGAETNHFYGQMGPLFIFDDHLTQAQVKLVYQSCVDRLINTLGMSCFGELESKIFLYYNSTARAGKYFLDLSPEKGREKRLDAKATGNLHSSVIRDVKDIIHCLGGIKVLFPIFAQLDQPLAPENSQDEIDYTIDKHALRQAFALLGDMLNKSETNQREMVRSQGFSVISYLIQRLSPEHLTTETIVTMEDFVSKIRNGVIPIMDEFLVHSVFNWKIWINASNAAQCDLVILLHNYIKSNTDYMRKLIGVQKLLDVLGFYYWYESKGLPGFLPGIQPIYHPITNKLQGQRPTDSEIHSLRKSIFNSIQFLITPGITEAEMQAIIRCTVDCQDNRQLLEILTFIRDALVENLPNFADSLLNFASTSLFVLLLRNDDEQIRIMNLSIINLLYKNQNMKDKKKLLAFRAIGRILGDYPFTINIYKTLFSIMTNSSGSVIIDDHVTITEVQMLPVIFKLLLQSELLIRQKALQEIYLLISNNAENRDILLNFEGWLVLLFSVLGSTNFEDPKAVLEIIYNTCKVLILHSFAKEKFAYKLLQQTIAVIMVLSSKNIVDHVEVTRTLFTKILNLLISQFSRSKPAIGADRRNTWMNNNNQQKEATASSNILINMIYLCTIMEEFLFYTPNASAFLAIRSVSTSMNTHLTDNNEWMDIELARLFLDTVAVFKLNDNTHSALLEQVCKDSPKNSILRSGGIQRILLRIALYVIREGDVKACVENIPRVRILLDKDLANSKVEISSRLSFALSCLLLLTHRIVNERPDEIGKSKATVPLTKDLLRACVSVLPPAAEARQFQYLSETSTIKEFTNSFTTNQWVDYLIWARNVCSNMDSEDKGFIATIDKKRTKFVNDVLSYMQRETKIESESERKISMEFQTINEKILQPEFERKKNEFQKMESETRHQQRNWRHIYRSLTNERAPWGTMESNVYWKLNKTENFSRMRLKMKRNYNFDPYIDAAREQTETPQELESSEREDDKNNILNQLKCLNLGNVKEEIADEVIDTITIDEIDNNNQQEKLIYSTSCELITPLIVTKGKLEITLTGINFKEEGDVTLPKEVKIPLDEISEVHLRRYLLRQSALEIFLIDRSNYFINISKRERDKVYNKILSINPPNLKYHETGLPEQILKKSDMIRKWQMRLISNFDYLMYLNTLSGRSYNDITQYPVFPWVISNYESETIDLNDTSNYRDLSKPIGALNPKRLEMFKARYENFVDPDIPQFYYGSHYSSSGIVLFYLIRVEPFTSQFLKLQGGKFDHADRMFDTIPKTWQNVLNASSDVKELIPEFFYFPDFLSNSNKFNLGCKQGGVPMGDVGLPPWAKTPEEFIRINRAALESEYVSSHLHEWIDLIFGFKQRGRDAIDSYNVFYYLTYEGAVDIDAIPDEDQRKATESQIDNFGQTPAQLVTRPHPPRVPLVDSHQTISYRMANKLATKTYPITISTDALSYVCLPGYSFNCSSQINPVENDIVITVTENRFVATHKFSTVPNSMSIHPFTFEMDNFALGKKKIGAPFAADLSVSSQCFATGLDGKIVVSCGHWDYSIKCSWVDNSKAPQSLVKHKDIVTCLAMAVDGKTFVSGSKDTTVLVWDIVYQKGSPIKVEENPIHVLYGHNDEVTCVAVDIGLDICVSGSNDGTCIVHDLRHGNYVRSIYHPNNLPINLVCVSPLGHVVFFSRMDGMLYLYNINGVFLCSLEIKENIETMMITPNSQFLITGSVEGQLVIRQLHSLKLLNKVSANIKICSLALSSDETYLFAGLGDGNLLILTVEDKVRMPIFSAI